MAATRLRAGGFMLAIALATTLSAAETAPQPRPASGNPRGEPLLFEANANPVKIAGDNWWSVSVSPDGKQVATSQSRGETGEVRIWDRETGKVKHVIAEPGGVRAVAFSPDGTLLATGNYDKSIRFYETAAFKPLGVAKGHTSGVNGLCFFKNGRHLASAGLDKTTRIWDLSALKAKKDVETVAIFEGHTQGVLSVSVSADGRTLLSGSLDKSARCYDVPELPKAGQPPVTVKKERVLLGGHNAAVEAVAVSPDGKLLATGSWDARVLIRDRDGLNETSLPFNIGVMCMTFSPDGRHLAIGTGNTPVPEQAGELRVWDVTEKKQVATNNYPSSVLGVSFTPDGKTVASVGQDRVLHLWTFDGMERKTHRDEGTGFAPQPYLAGTLSPDGDLIAVAGEGKSAFILDRRKSKFVAELTGHDDAVAAMAFSPDGKTLATASHDKTIKMWNTATWKERKTLTGHTGAVQAVAFAPDGRTLASGSYDKTVRFWNAGTGTAGAVWKDHGAGVRALAFSPDGSRLASAGSDRTVRITMVADGTKVHVLKGHKGAVRTLAFSPDGQFVASGSEDKSVKLWDAAAGKEANSFAVLPDMVAALAFSPRGQSIAAATFQGPVVILDPLTGRTRQTLRFHGEPVSAVAFADGGATLVTISQDRNIQQCAVLKDVPVPPLQSLAAKIGIVSAAAFTPDGRTAVLGNGEGEIIEWNWKGDETRFRARHPGGVACLAISNDRRVASVGKDDTLRVGTGKEPEWTGKGRFALFTPDGKQIAVAEEKDIVLRNAATGNEVKRFAAGHEGNVTRLALSPDGRFLLSTGDDTKVRLWNVATGAKVQDAPAFGSYSTVLHLAFSPDGSRFAAAAFGPEQPPPEDMTGTFRLIREVRVFTMPAGDGPLAAPLVVQPQPNDQPITGLEWTADGQSLVMPAMDGTIRVVEIAAGGAPRETQRFRGHASAVMAAAFSLETGTFITAGEDLAVRRWRMPGTDPLPGQARLTPAGLTRFWQMLPSPDGKWFVGAGEGDKAFRVYSALPVSLPVEPDRHGSIYSLAFSPDNRFLVTGHDTGAIVVRDAATGRTLRTIAGMKKRVFSLAYAEKGAALVAVGGNIMNGAEPGEAFIWNFADGTVRHKLDVPGLQWMAAVHPNGKSFAAAGNDGTVRIWDVASGKPVKQLTPEIPRGLYSVAYDASGDRIATGVTGGRVRIWDVAGEKILREIRTTPDLRPSQALFSPDGKEIVVSLWRGTGPDRKPEIAAYSIADRDAAPRQFAAHAASVMNIAFLADGKTLVASGGENNGIGSVRAFDYATGKALGQFTGHRNWVQTLAVSADGKLASASWGTPLNGELKLWDTRGLQPIAEVPVPGETQYISTAAISRDSKLLVLGGWGQTITAWDMSNPAKPVLRKQSKDHAAPVRSLAFDNSGSRFVSADESGVVKVWDAATLELIVSFKASENAVYRAKFTPDGSAIVTVGGKYQTKAKGEIAVWNPRDGKLVTRFPEQAREVWDIVFLNDGKRMAAIHTPNGGPDDSHIKIWDFDRKEVIRTLLPPGAFPGGRCLGLSADGKRLAIGSGSGPVKVFDTATWRETLNLPGLGNCTFGVNFTRDSGTLLIASGEGSGISVGLP